MGLQHSFAFNQNTILAIDYLIVAGGGGGGGSYATFGGGGGGAGGLVSGSLNVFRGTQYPITIGVGGAPSIGAGVGQNGSTSSFNDTIVYGGGGGGSYQTFGSAGASGGGNPSTQTSQTPSGNIPGQGNVGGLGTSFQGFVQGGGGGGGSAQAGVSVVIGSVAGNGGSGSLWYDGISRAGGGGGGSGSMGIGIASSGGGNGDGSYGTANTGGGGGGANGNGGGYGGSGVVVIRYSGPQQATGGTVSTISGYTYHTFNSNGTFEKT